MSEPGKITLAIESAICGGSISLARDGIEIANWLGSADVSKAEDLLVNIDSLLRSNNVSSHDINLIAVSAGPGSFTGVRIGIATALGLRAGLRAEISSESALRAMACQQSDHPNIVAAVPMGRDAICLQSFEKKSREVTSLNEPHSISGNDLVSMIRENPIASFVVHSSLFEKIGSSKVADFGLNIAYAVGLTCLENPHTMVEPLFISKGF